MCMEATMSDESSDVIVSRGPAASTSHRIRPSRWDGYQAVSVAAVEERRRNRPHLDLFLISFGILFLELACIRWFASTVIFLTFFTNLVLLACFLGMSVGCLAASRKQDLIKTVLPLSVMAVVLAGLV